MGTIFLNSKNVKTSKPYVLILTFNDKLDLRRGEKVLPYQILAFITHGETKKTHIITINSKYQLQHGMINLNYQMAQILIFKIILSIF